MIPIEATFVRPSDRRVGMVMEFRAPSGEVVQRPIDFNIDTRQFVARVDIATEPGPAPLPVQQAQTEAFAPAPLDLSFGAIPGVGHLLILCINTPTAITTDLAALGYTRIVGTTSSGAMYHKVAGPSEPTDLSVAFGASGTRASAVWMEWEQMAATPLGVFSSNPSSGNVASKSSGTTADTVQANNLAIAMFYFGSGTQISGISWTNGYTSFASARNLYVGSALHGVIGPAETTMAWTSGLRTMAGHIVTFKAAIPTAGTASPRQYFTRFVVLEVPAGPPLPEPPIPPELVAVPTTPSIRVASGKLVTSRRALVDARARRRY